jgi:uncharacterized repeat protein (TIGR02543 family)
MVLAQRYSTFYLTVGTNIPDAGTVSPGSGSYYYGTTATITETTNPGFTFDGWYLDGNYQGSLSSIKITMDRNHQLTATFSNRSVTLTIIVTPHEGGTTLPTSGTGTYEYGDSVLVR